MKFNLRMGIKAGKIILLLLLVAQPVYSGDQTSESPAEKEQASKQRELLLFYDESCPWCLTMHRELSEGELAAFVERRFVLRVIDITKPESFPFQIQYGVQTVPFLVIRSSDGTFIRSTRTARFEIEGTYDHDLPKLRAWLESTEADG